MKKIRVFAPATVANVGCGYDTLGFALSGYGDQLVMRLRDDEEHHITIAEGGDGIPTDPERNVCSYAVGKLLAHLGETRGFDYELRKTIPPGSGLGSSASSSAAAVFAANELLGRPLSRLELVPFAMEGERAASAKAHADNVAPSLLGGFTVVRGYDPLDVFNIPYPENLRVAILYPEVEVKTSDAKKILKRQVEMQDAITQWGNVAGLVSGLILGDFERIGRSLEDVIVEPVRKILIPYYDEAKSLAMENGALGFSISGSGPSMFALTNGDVAADTVRHHLDALYEKKGIACMSFVSPINPEGTVIR